MREGSIAGQIDALYGPVDWTRAAGCLHVAAIDASSGDVIAIGPAAPRSPTDRFVLGFARARADVILTTGSILRSEPDLVHRYSEDAEEQAGWAAWRRDVLGRAESPRLLVLSASGRFPLDHPALTSARGWIWTTEVGAAHLEGAPSGLEIVTAPATLSDPVSAAVDFALSEQASASGTPDRVTVSVEAGPTAAARLYAPRDEAVDAQSAGVDELLLSCFEGTLSEAARGPSFVAASLRSRRLGSVRSAVRVDEASGAWTFERYRAER